MRPCATPLVELEIQAEMLDLALIPMDTDADGRLVRGDFRVRGPGSNPFIDGEFLFDNVRLAGEAFDIVQGKLRHDGSGLERADLALIPGNGRTRRHGGYSTS